MYFDPPYVPMSATASFTHYTGQTFGPDDQRRLARLFDELMERGVYVMLSNSHTPLSRELYAAHAVRSDVVLASRKINCDGRARQRRGADRLRVCAGDVRQELGDRRQETGDKRQETGDRSNHPLLSLVSCLVPGRPCRSAS